MKAAASHLSTCNIDKRNYNLFVAITFDSDKDAANVVKHGISLARAADMRILARVNDPRFAEVRYRAYGLIDGLAHCLAYVLRKGEVRAISLRRAHAKEFRRHVR